MRKFLNALHWPVNLIFQLTVTWELKPIAPRKELFSSSTTSAKLPPRAPLRLVVVLDISCSMEEPYGPDGISKLDKIKMFVRLLVENMSPEDDLGIVTFGTVSNVALPLTRMDLDGKVSEFNVVRGLFY